MLSEPRFDIRRPAVLLAICIAVAPQAAPDTAAQRQEVTKSFDRTLTVTPSQALRVDHRHGDVGIRTHARNELQIRASIRVSAASQAAASEFAERILIEVLETPTAITLRTEYPQQRKSWRRLIGGRDPSFSVDYTLLMPERMPLELHNSFGDVSVAGLKADAAIVNAHGRLSVVDGAGRHRLENAFGAIEAARLAGDVTITGANGSVSAATIGGGLNVTNRFGNVTVAAIKGAAVIANSNGAVDLTSAASANVTNSFGLVTVGAIAGDASVGNSNGRVTAKGIKGKADLRTTFGRLELEDVGLAASVANTNGDVVVLKVGGAATVTSRFGVIDLGDIGGAVTVENANGSVKLSNVRDGATVKTSFGGVDAQAVKGSVRVTNGNGNVRVSDVDGPLFVKTTFGLVSVERIRGALTVDNSNGGVQGAAIQGGVDVKTSFGPVVLRDVHGRVDVRNQNGAIDAALVARPGPCHDVTLGTSFSAIQVALPERGYIVTARTTFGRIRSDVPISMTGTMGENSLSGTIGFGSGGCALHLMNANGDIRIVKLVSSPAKP